MEAADAPKLLRVVLSGAVLALSLQTIATVALLGLQHNGREIAAAAFGSAIVTTSLGFAFIARSVSGRGALIIAIVFFPTMLGLMFFEAMYLDATMYGNTF